MIDLGEAGVRLRSYQVEPTPDVDGIHRRRRRRQRRRSAIVATGSLAIAGALTGLGLGLMKDSTTHKVVTSPAGNPSPATSGLSGDRAVLTIKLDRTTVPAGTVIHGLAILDNGTGARIPIPGGKCNGWPLVGLSNPGHPYQPISGGVACRAFSAPTGQTQYPIEVFTTPTVCLPTASQTSCPPLPAGKYKVTVIQQSSAITVAKIPSVTLTAPEPGS